jgi:hypothetical protein
MSVMTTDEKKILVPLDNRERLSIKQAAAIADVSESTMRNWCDKYGLGRRIGGKWAVSRVALAMHLDGNLKALKAYHACVWTDPGVAAYFEREGLDLIKARLRSNGKVSDRQAGSVS